MSSKLLSALLVSGALLVAGQAFAVDGQMVEFEAAHASAKAKTHKKAKAAAPAATAKASQANISGTGTITGPITLAGAPPAAPAPAAK